MSTYCTPTLIQFARNQAKAALAKGTFEVPDYAGFEESLAGAVAAFESGNWGVVHTARSTDDVTVLQWGDDYVAIGDSYGPFVVRFSWDQYAADSGMTNEGE